ncbi:hypothetical protein, partial [Klebsiella pneumoniae]|uniref:hypothetical protein n=1 Tax=Klebsiella pneumoniae TaxID=573 RepID=UPI0019D09C15
MEDYYRHDRNQHEYWKCRGTPDGNLAILGAGHSAGHIQAKTLGSLFYRRKVSTNRIYSAIRSYIRNGKPGEIYKENTMCWESIEQLVRDIQGMMLSDY